MLKNKKLVVFLLLAAQCLAFSACGNAASETESAQTEVVETAAAVETEPELSDDLPARDYAGAEFRMLSYETVNCNGVHVVAEITGEGVNDATYKINRDLEERFGIIMKETLDSGMTNGGVQNTILAGDDAFELIFPYTNGSFAFLQKNCVLEYSMLPYVNLEKPYWVASLNESASIGGKHYYAMGGLDLSHMDYTHMQVDAGCHGSGYGSGYL